MNAIPTRYNGVQFRSRLEARWAAMFDLLQWKWEYEPIDLEGYIPDFILQFKRPLLVEVKPIIRRSDFTLNHLINDKLSANATNKILASGWSDEAVVVGASHDETPAGHPSIGRFAIEYWDWVSAEETGNVAPSNVVVFTCSNCGCVSLRSDDNSYACRVNGCWNGDHFLDPAPDTNRLWREAGNRVQWRGASAIT